MAHVPHLYLPAPWEGDELTLSAPAVRHLTRVLRRRDGSPVTYTDGAGTLGEGMLAGEAVRRGAEHRVPGPAPAVTLAVAAPQSTDRARFLVEKLAELGVDRLVWVTTEHGQARPPKPAKASSWAVAALEQRRGAHLLEVDGPMPAADLTGTVWVADPGGGLPPEPGQALTVLVGPEGGLAPGEAPGHAIPVALGPSVLRVETAAVAGALLALQAVGRFPTSRRSFANPAER